MMKIKLPINRLREVREELWAELRQPDRISAEAAYEYLLEAISHPIAIARGRLVSGTIILQYSLNLLIFLRRLIWPVVLLLFVVAYLHSWYFLLGIPTVIVFNLFVLNNLQTRINVELAARLMVLDENIDNFDENGKVKL